MRKINITLEVTPLELEQIATILNKECEPTKTTIQSTCTTTPVVPPSPKPGGKKSAKMPSFGRTQAQINEFIEHESERVAKLDEKEALKQQRAEEKAARESAETAEANKALDEVAAIKQEAAITKSAGMPTKLWNL